MKNEDTTDAETDAETGAEEAWCPPMPDAPDDPTESEIAGAADKLETMMRGSLFFFLEFGRYRTVARSLHEHKLSKTTFVQGH